MSEKLNIQAHPEIHGEWVYDEEVGYLYVFRAKIVMPNGSEIPFPEYPRVLLHVGRIVEDPYYTIQVYKSQHEEETEFGIYGFDAAKKRGEELFLNMCLPNEKRQAAAES